MSIYTFKMNPNEHHCPNLRWESPLRRGRGEFPMWGRCGANSSKLECVLMWWWFLRVIWSLCAMRLQNVRTMVCPMRIHHHKRSFEAERRVEFNYLQFPDSTYICKTRILMSKTVTERCERDLGAQQLSPWLEPVYALSWVELVQCPHSWWPRNSIHVHSFLMISPPGIDHRRSGSAIRGAYRPTKRPGCGLLIGGQRQSQRISPFQ